MRQDLPIVPLGDVLSLSNRAIASSELMEINLAGVYSFGRGLFKRGPMKPAETSYRSYNRLVQDDFVISEPKAWEGALARVTAEFEGWFLSPVFPTFTANSDRLLPAYLEWFCKRRSVWRDLQILSKGMGARRETVSPEQFLSLRIPLPPLKEQRHVVARIEELSGSIGEAHALRQGAVEETAALTNARISAMFEGGECWKSVQDAVSSAKGAVRSGPFGSQLLHQEFRESGVAAVGTRDVQRNRFQLCGGWFVSPEKFRQFTRYQVHPGDVLCTIVGASIGRFCVVPEDVPLAFTTKHIQALTLDSARADARFVSFMLNFHRRCRESLFSQVEGSAQPSLNAGKILATALPLPPVAEQRRIVAELDALEMQVDALIQLQAATAEELDALLPAVLDRAFRGELR